MTYRIQAFRYARKAGRVCRVITSSARAETAEQAEEIRAEFIAGHPKCTVEVKEIAANRREVA